MARRRASHPGPKQRNLSDPPHTSVLIFSPGHTARTRPVLVAFMGSTSDEPRTPRMPLYIASKNYTRKLAPSLHADERFDTPDEKAISFMLIHLGTVRSALIVAPVNFWRPSSELFAKKLVGTFGCGRQYVVPYVGHAIALKMHRTLPKWYVDRGPQEGIRAQLERERLKLAGLKKQ